MDIGWRVREVAEAQGVRTATELAERIGVNINTAFDLWAGRTIRIDRTTLGKLCRAFDVEPGEFFTRDTGSQQKPDLVAAA